MQIKVHKNKGFTILETLIYSIGLVILVGVIASLMYYMYNWYQYATISSKVDQVGLTIMDRIVRDIRTGRSIDLAQSVFGSASGAILVNAKVNGVSVTKKFATQSQRMTYQEDGGTVQYLSPSNMQISSFYLTNLSVASTSQAVKVDLQITYTTKDGQDTHSFSGLSIMRSSYR